MKGFLFAASMICLLLISGCSQEIACNKPYIKIGSECCLDSDDNTVCDKDEQVKEEIKPEKEEQVEQKAQPYCGDGSCGSDEDCDNCEDDCGCSSDQFCDYDIEDKIYLCVEGETPTMCGDGTCDPGESCSNCKDDCGECKRYYDLEIDRTGGSGCSRSKDILICDISNDDVPSFYLVYRSVGAKPLHDIKTEITCEKVHNGLYEFYLEDIDGYFLQGTYTEGAVFAPKENMAAKYGEYVTQLASDGAVQYVVNMNLSEILEKESVCDIERADRGSIRCTVEVESGEGASVKSTINMNIDVEKYSKIDGC